MVLPVFNAADTIERAVRSILAQTLTRIELIVVNDGSTDGTDDVVARMNDDRLRLVSQPHRGVAASANRGTRLAQAPFIARMDADDFAHPQRLAEQLRWLEQQSCDLVGCQVNLLDEQGRTPASLRRYEHWINEETLNGEQIAALRFVELPLVNPTILARRKYFELEFAEHDLPEDYDLLLRAAAGGMTFGKVPRVLYDWIDRPHRLTRTDPRYAANAFFRCREQHLFAGPLQGASAVDLWGVGQTGKPWLRVLQSRGITVRRAYDVHPRKIGARDSWCAGACPGRPAAERRDAPADRRRSRRGPRSDSAAD